MPSEERSPRPLPAGLRVYVLSLLGFTCLSLLSLLRLALRGDPLDFAMLWSHDDDRFGDFWHYHQLFQHLHTQAFFTAQDRFAYPAPCAVLYAALYRLPHPHLVYSLVLLAAWLVSGVFFYRLLRRFSLQPLLCLGVTALVLLTSYPWQRLFDRSNLEVFVYILLALGLWANLRGKLLLAAVLWGLAGALKLYPLAVLAIYLHRHTLRYFAAGLGAFALSMAASFWYVGPTLRAAALGTLDGVRGFAGNYAANAHRSELPIDHSILGSLKEVLSVHILHLGNRWPSLGRNYEYLAALVLLSLYFGILRKLPLLNQLGFLLIAITVFPPVSFDYTLVHTYLAMGLVLGSCLFQRQHRQTLPHVETVFFAFGLLATAQMWASVQSLSLNGCIKCGALLWLSAFFLRVPLTMGLPVEDLFRRHAPAPQP